MITKISKTLIKTTYILHLPLRLPPSLSVFSFFLLWIKNTYIHSRRNSNSTNCILIFPVLVLLHLYSSYKKMQSDKGTVSMEVEEAGPSDEVKVVVKPNFKPLTAHEISDGQVQFRKVSVPKHRYTPLKKAWMDIYTPIYDQMKVDIRMNVKTRKVEMMTTRDTPDISHLQKCADFVHAFMLGFDVADAVALLRMDELYVDSFEIKDVKTLRGEHLSRAIGRLSGKGGKTRFAIENSTKTRIVIADTKIHILGSFANIKVARDSLCSLILGSPAGKVYSKLRAVTARLAERF